jgi:SAM-dependent methyltransferase
MEATMTTVAATTATFDPMRYKESTLEQWQAAADAWNRWGPQLERWLGPATEVMLDLAAVATGAKVLDIAAGAGGQTLAAARRVGPQGRVLATDVAPAILDFADANARAAGFSNVHVQVLDGEQLDVEPGHFDAVISRVGLIYFPDRQRALAGILRALRPGGRLAAIVYSTPERNPFFSIPVSVIRERAQLPPPAPGQPGPFSLGAPGVAEQALADAGFTDVVAVRIDAPLRLSSVDECLRFEQESFGALHQMLSGLDEAGREAAWQEIRERLAAFETGDGFSGPCELIVVAGRAPEAR